MVVIPLYLFYSNELLCTNMLRALSLMFIFFWLYSSMTGVYFCFFFFKQKTAYEMRISDWSSDVCSSDLLADPTATELAGAVLAGWMASRTGGVLFLSGDLGAGKTSLARGLLHARSEEHTSELQSLMRISYAVFCLKKKNKLTI